MITDFVRRNGTQLQLCGADFRIVGANNYYLGFVDSDTAAQVLDLAHEHDMNVLRIWAFCEQQTPDQGFFYQSWLSEGPVYNHDALCRLDAAVALASERGIRLILTLVNNWQDFGGMPAYLQWFAQSGHDAFYRDGRCRAAYWLYVEHLLHRTNTISGRAYNQDPTILAWELANEPRCPDTKDGEALLLSWVSEMATLVKAHAPRQLVAVGDEGFFRRSGAGRNTLYNGTHGVNFEAILDIAPVDFGTFHFYGDWAKNDDVRRLGRSWIEDHVDAGRRANKPVLLEEYGVRLDSGPPLLPEQRAAIYADWHRTVEQSGCAGDLAWMLGLPKSPKQPYSPDSYVLEPGPELEQIRQHACRLNPGKR